MKLTPRQWSDQMTRKLIGLQQQRSEFFLTAVEGVVPVFISRIRTKKVDAEGNFFGRYATDIDKKSGNEKGDLINITRTGSMLDSLNSKVASTNPNLTVVNVATKGTRNFFAAKSLTEEQGFNIFLLNDAELNILQKQAEEFYIEYFFGT